MRNLKETITFNYIENFMTIEIEIKKSFSLEVTRLAGYSTVSAELIKLSLISQH